MIADRMLKTHSPKWAPRRIGGMEPSMNGRSTPSVRLSATLDASTTQEKEITIRRVARIREAGTLCGEQGLLAPALIHILMQGISEVP